LEPVAWFTISIVLLSLLGIIFDSGWILKFLRNNFLEGSFFPFIDYSSAFLNWMPKQTENQLFWILSLAACINPFVIMRENNYASILLVLPIIFLVYLWENHSSGSINKVIYGILALIAVIFPLATLVFPQSFQLIGNFHSINLINSLIFTLMLYWIRWWVVIPYDYLTHK
jgi:hypothetical protein